MTSPDIVSTPLTEIGQREQTPGEVLVTRIMEGLGKSYVLERNYEAEPLENDPRPYFYRYLRISKRGFLGTKPFMTLFADAGFMREMEIKDKLKEPLQKIQGWTTGTGYEQKNYKPGKEDVPQAVRDELEKGGVKFYPTTGTFVYKDDKTGKLEIVTTAAKV